MKVKEKILEMVQKRESDIPTLPVVIDQIVSTASDDKSTVDQLAKIISFDQAMTNKLLQLANSMYYGQRNKVETIKRAIAVIGFDEIIGIAMGMGILSTFSHDSKLSLDMKALWIHGIGVATTAKALAMRTNPSIANKVFVPALLHDIGKVIFSLYFKEEYMKAREFSIEKKKPLYVAEKKVLKIDHTMVSALLMKRWNFPASIIYPSRFHHCPEAAPTQLRYQSLILNLADYLTQKAGIGYSGNPIPVAVKNVGQKIGITDQVLHLSMDQLKRKENEINDFFRVTTQ